MVQSAPPASEAAMQEPAGELPYFAGQRRHQTTNLGVRSSNLFGRAT